MQKTSTLVLLTALLGLAAGCNNAPPLSCDTGASCTDYVSGFSETAAADACTSTSGTFSTEVACPTANRVGRCEITVRNVTSIVNIYPPLTEEDARSICMGTATGVTYTFTPG